MLAEVTTSRAELAARTVGNILENKLTKSRHTVTAVSADGGWLELDGWYGISLNDAARQFKRVGKMDLSVKLHTSRQSENLGEGVQEWRAA